MWDDRGREKGEGLGEGETQCGTIEGERRGRDWKRGRETQGGGRERDAHEERQMEQRWA